MVKKFKTFESRPTVVEQNESAITLSKDAVYSIYKKSQKSGISTAILEEVYRRGFTIWNESFGSTAEQFAFDRVNSFIAGGFAAILDEDLVESQYFAIATPKGGKKYSKQKASWRRVPDTKFSSEERAHEYGKKYHSGGYKVVTHPDSRIDENVTSEPISKNKNDPANRFVGTDELVNNFKDTTPGQQSTRIQTIKKAIKK